MFCVRTIFGVRFGHRLYLNYVRHSIWGGALHICFGQRLLNGYILPPETTSVFLLSSGRFTNTLSVNSNNTFCFGK